MNSEEGSRAGIKYDKAFQATHNGMPCPSLLSVVKALQPWRTAAALSKPACVPFTLLKHGSLITVVFLQISWGRSPAWCSILCMPKTLPLLFGVLKWSLKSSRAWDDWCNVQRCLSHLRGPSNWLIHWESSHQTQASTRETGKILDVAGCRSFNLHKMLPDSP